MKFFICTSFLVSAKAVWGISPISICAVSLRTILNQLSIKPWRRSGTKNWPLFVFRMLKNAGYCGCTQSVAIMVEKLSMSQEEMHEGHVWVQRMCEPLPRYFWEPCLQEPILPRRRYDWQHKHIFHIRLNHLSRLGLLPLRLMAGKISKWIFCKSDTYLKVTAKLTL